MSEDGAGTPAIGAIRIVGNDLLTFDGTEWRPLVRVGDNGQHGDLRIAALDMKLVAIQRLADDASGEPGQPEPPSPVDQP